MSALARRFAARATIGVTRLVTGARGVWTGCEPHAEQRIYFANHTSHGDFALIWTAIPKQFRAGVRPVAAADYWNATRLRRFFSKDVFDAVLIERNGAASSRRDPLAPIKEALADGASLIFFPEGTRNTTQEALLPFKSGLCRLARAAPHVPLTPVWIHNVGRVMPKGEFLPVPLLCRVTFGAPMHLAPAEDRDDFLRRARNALLDLRPAVPGMER
jgi:1-acyl-sn-glycerol-3-phosphate acyltransferase